VSDQSPDPEITGAVGVGLATVTADGTVLDTWYPQPKLVDAGIGGTVRLTAEQAADALGTAAAGLLGVDEDRGVEVVGVRTTIGTLATVPAGAHDVYLRLHLLSHRLVQPNGQNLEGVFGLLSTVVWTNHGPCPVEGFEETRLRLRSRGQVTVSPAAPP
jgi:2,3,4,5-tetrahydropyridine-2-carboxylate N-succinyltransferase